MMMETTSKFALVLTAAGSSTRLGTGEKKEFMPFKDGTVLSAACFSFLNTLKEKLSLIVITYPKEKKSQTEAALFCDARIKQLSEEYATRVLFAEGGGTRQESVRNALEVIAASCESGTCENGANSRGMSNVPDSGGADGSTGGSCFGVDFVLIHDAARPWVTPEIIEDACVTAQKYGSAVPAVPATDTLAVAGCSSATGANNSDKSGASAAPSKLTARPSNSGVSGAELTDKTILSYIDRSTAFCLQTPQCFAFKELLEAHRAVAAENRSGCTDDTTVWAAYCSPVHLSKGSPANKKITFAADLADLANATAPTNSATESYTKHANYAEPAPRATSLPQADISGGTHMNIRTGLGYDLHRLTEGRKLMLGGVEIPFEKGEDGHSDGDVLLHAITDALLGAAGLGDIGELFPPSDNRWKGADSRELLHTAWKKVSDGGWRIENIDCVVALEKPKFLPYREQVRKSIAAVLGCPAESVFVKAKTGEKLGKIGRGEAVEAWVTCLISR